MEKHDGVTQQEMLLHKLSGTPRYLARGPPLSHSWGFFICIFELRCTPASGPLAERSMRPANLLRRDKRA